MHAPFFPPCTIQWIPNPGARKHFNWIEENILDDIAGLLTAAIIALGAPYVRALVRRTQQYFQQENNAVINQVLDYVFGAEPAQPLPLPRQTVR